MRQVWMFGLVGLMAVAGCERGDHPVNIGLPAKQFVVSDGSQTVDLSKLRGKTVVLNLWATWCAPCVEELPSLLAMHHELPDVEIVAVSIDQDEGDLSEVSPAASCGFDYGAG